MLNRLILKVTKFHLLLTVWAQWAKTFWGAIMPLILKVTKFHLLLTVWAQWAKTFCPPPPPCQIGLRYSDKDNSCQGKGSVMGVDAFVTQFSEHTLQALGILISCLKLGLHVQFIVLRSI